MTLRNSQRNKNPEESSPFYLEQEKKTKRKPFNASAHLPQQIPRNIKRKSSNDPIFFNKNHPRQKREEPPKLQKRTRFVHPHKHRKQAQSKVYLVKEMGRRRKRDAPSSVYLEKTKLQAEKKSQNSEQLLGKILDVVKSINEKIPLLNISNSASLGNKKNGLTLKETLKLLGLAAHQHKGVVNSPQKDSTNSHASSASTADNLSLLRQKIISLKKKVDLHKVKYGIKHGFREDESTSTAIPTTTSTQVPEDVLKLNKYKALSHVLDHLNEQYNQESNHSNPAIGDNLLELLEKVIDFEDSELNSTLNATGANLKLYESGFVVFVSAFVVLLVIFLLLCFFYNYEVRSFSRKGGFARKKDPIFKVSPRREIRKDFGPSMNEHDSHNATALQEMLRSANFPEDHTQPKERNNKDIARREFLSMEALLKWNQEQRSTRKSGKNNLLSAENSRVVDRLDPKCSFYQENREDPGSRLSSGGSVKKISSGQQSLENWTKSAVKDVVKNAKSLSNGRNTTGVRGMVDPKLHKWFK